MKKGKQLHCVRLHAYCLMSTHWHLALSAEEPELISKCLGWLCTQHASAFRRSTGTVGLGHVYQGRFCDVRVEGIIQYVRLIRYTEANPLEAGMVRRAEDWKWSSLRERLAGETWLDPGPWTLPSDWLSVVNAPDVKVELLPDLLGQVATFLPPPVVFPW